MVCHFMLLLLITAFLVASKYRALFNYSSVAMKGAIPRVLLNMGYLFKLFLIYSLFLVYVVIILYD